MKTRIAIGIAIVVVVIAALAYLSRSEPTTVTVYERAGWYVADVDGPQPRVVRIGHTAAEAAVAVTQIMLQDAVENPLGGTLVAPAEVLQLVPTHLHQVGPSGTAP